MERVIQGTNTYLSYYCGGCEHTWTVPDTLPHALPPSPRKPPPPKRKPPHR